jgi:hypothetical protein
VQKQVFSSIFDKSCQGQTSQQPEKYVSTKNYQSTNIEDGSAIQNGTDASPQNDKQAPAYTEMPPLPFNRI